MFCVQSRRFTVLLQLVLICMMHDDKLYPLIVTMSDKGCVR